MGSEAHASGPRDLVLVYVDEGVDPSGLEQTLHCLREALPKRRLKEVLAADLLAGALSDSVALLVVPGGRDDPYVEKLSTRGVALIREFVRRGGAYVGICAGAYFGASFCEFEKGTKMEDCGPRDLALFAGTAVGSAFGFSYSSTRFSKAAPIEVARPVARAAGLERCVLKTYVNGGCYFQGARDEEVLAWYTGDPGGKADGQPMVVAGSLGSGRWVLTGAHLEYEPTRLTSTVHHDRLRPDLLETNGDRLSLMAYLLARALGHQQHRSLL